MIAACVGAVFATFFLCLVKEPDLDEEEVKRVQIRIIRDVQSSDADEHDSAHLTDKEIECLSEDASFTKASFYQKITILTK